MTKLRYDKIHLVVVKIDSKYAIIKKTKKRSR